MSKVNGIQKHLAVIVFLFLYFATNAQQKKDLFSPYKIFVDTTDLWLKSTTKIHHNFLLKSSKSNNAKLNEALTILRQLSDSVFIVSITDDNFYLQNALDLVPVNNYWKLSAGLLEKVKHEANNISASFLIRVKNVAGFKSESAKENLNISGTTQKNTFIIADEKKSVLEFLLADENVQFISIYNRQPKTETQINSLDLSANNIDLLHSSYPKLNGDSLVVSIKENFPDTSDIDLKGRYNSNPLEAQEISSHATIMGTMITGAGNSWYLGRGVASGANFTSSDFINLLPDDDANYHDNNITVQNHSYGVGVENFYGADAAAYDESSLTNDKLLFVFSAGNSGNITPTAGEYAGIENTANLTGSFKMAKNILTVGAIDSFNNVSFLSSKGPAYDGRIKPEMVAYGEDGSSGAAALVSGTALLLQQVYKNAHAGTLPNSSLVKAVLLNSCDDVATEGIDFSSGYGNLNSYRAVKDMQEQKYFSGIANNGSIQNFTIAIPANCSKAKFTLVWNDEPASPNAYRSLQNDLDLQLKENSSGKIYLPWVLNASPDKDSIVLLPVRKRDSLNNIEQVTLDNPNTGNYTLSVNGFDVPTGAQNFSIAYQFDSANYFYWKFPSRNDNIFSAAANLIRWGSTFSSGTGSIDYSINNGSSWKNIAANVNLATGYTSWTAPDTAVLALLRITIGARQFVSDTFTISDKPDIKVGFNCKDSVLLFWDKIKGINNYQIYSLGAKYLQQITQVADTQFVFNKNNLTGRQFAVAPIIKNKIGVKSYTINYNTQGVDCYIANLLADLKNDNTGFIQLQLGTTFIISKIVFEKQIGVSFIPFQSINNISGLQYNVTDNSLQKGLNIYRVALYLANGEIIYSNTVSVLYFNNEKIIIYPNPVIRGNNLLIELKELNNQVITLMDITGRKVYQKTASGLEFIIPTFFSTGIYLLTIYDPIALTKNSFKVVIR